LGSARGAFSGIPLRIACDIPPLATRLAPGRLQEAASTFEDSRAARDQEHTRTPGGDQQWSDPPCAPFARQSVASPGDETPGEPNKDDVPCKPGNLHVLPRFLRVKVRTNRSIGAGRGSDALAVCQGSASAAPPAARLKPHAGERRSWS